MRSKSLGKNGITLTIFPHSLSLEVIIVKKKQKRHSESGTFRPDLLAASKRKSIWEGGDGKVPKGVKAPMAPAMFNPPMPARSSGRPWESCQRGGPSARCNKASVFTAAASWRRWIFATCSYRMRKMFQLKWTSSIAISCANQKETLEVISILKKQRFRIAMANFLDAANVSNQTDPSFVLDIAIIMPWKQLVLVFPLETCHCLAGLSLMAALYSCSSFSPGAGAPFCNFTLRFEIARSQSFLSANDRAVNWWSSMEKQLQLIPWLKFSFHLLPHSFVYQLHLKHIKDISNIIHALPENKEMKSTWKAPPWGT